MANGQIGDGLAAWGRRLQLTRAVQWFAGNQGDPYALILRAVIGDPVPLEEQVRTHGPVFHSVHLNTWVTADRAVAAAALHDRRFGLLTRDGLPPGWRESPVGSALDHERDAYRRFGPLTAFGGPLLHAASPDEARRHAARTARDLLDGLGDQFDLAALARRVAAWTLADLFGLPDDRRPAFEAALTACGPTHDGWFCPQTLADAAATITGTAELAAVLREALEGRGPGGELTEAAMALAVGTAEPAATLLCNTVRTLLDPPEQWVAVCADPESVPRLVERTLRRFPAVRLVSLVAHEDVAAGGMVVPADGRLVVLMAPVGRDPGPAVGLPGDLAMALSAPLIRLIAQTGTRALAEAAPRLGLAGRAVRRRRSPVLHAHARLPVTTAAERTRGDTTDGRVCTEDPSRPEKDLSCAS